MLGKTHFAVGITVGLAVMHPGTIQELLLGAGAAAVGSVISDIDVGTSESRREADKITAAVGAAVAVVIAIEEIWHVGIYQLLMRDSNTLRIVIGITGFLMLCAFGRDQPHRSFMHSILAGALLTGCVGIFFPLAAPYFAAAFASHLAIDLLNKKKEKLFWPAKKGLSLGLCSSHGWINKLLLSAGTLSSCGIFLLTFLRILR